MKMKKLTCLGLALVMALSLTACGGNNSAGSNSNGAGNSNTGSSAGVQSTDNNNTQTELSGSVTTNGSTSMESVVLILKEAFEEANSGVTVNYSGSGSGAGVTSAIDGTADIGLASRALKDEEVANGLKSTTLALDGIAVIVNADSAISDLTVEQIAQLFKGEVANWSELGGADGAVACIGREGGSGTRDGFESITGTEDVCVLAEELTSTGAVIEAVRNNPQAIGYASLSAVEGQEGIKAITVNGVACSEETVLDGSYEIQRPFILVTKEGEALSEAAQAWFDWATSAAASDLIRAAGAVPMV